MFLMLDRRRRFLENPPADGWRGEWVIFSGPGYQ
jgi:hypothetical protein